MHYFYFYEGCLPPLPLLQVYRCRLGFGLTGPLSFLLPVRSGKFNMSWTSLTLTVRLVFFSRIWTVCKISTASALPRRLYTTSQFKFRNSVNHSHEWLIIEPSTRKFAGRAEYSRQIGPLLTVLLWWPVDRWLLSSLVQMTTIEPPLPSSARPLVKSVYFIECSGVLSLSLFHSHHR